MILFLADCKLLKYRCRITIQYNKCYTAQSHKIGRLSSRPTELVVVKVGRYQSYEENAQSSSVQNSTQITFV